MFACRFFQFLSSGIISPITLLPSRILFARRLKYDFIDANGRNSLVSKLSIFFNACFGETLHSKTSLRTFFCITLNFLKHLLVMAHPISSTDFFPKVSVMATADLSITCLGSLTENRFTHFQIQLIITYRRVSKSR